MYCSNPSQTGNYPYVPTDNLLLRLERMRMVDAAHAWAPRTLENACRTLRRIEKFFLKCQLPSSITKCNYHPWNIYLLIWLSLCSGVLKTTLPILQQKMVLCLHEILADSKDQLYLYTHHGHLPFAIPIRLTKIMTIECCL